MRGEAGVGKTRTIAEFTQIVHGRRTTVLAGRCDEEIRLPFAPLVAALDPLLSAGSAEWLAAVCGAAGADLCRLWPSIRARLPGLAEPLPSAPGIERLRLLDAVRALLERLSRDQPLTLVVDDLQWVDPSTLMLIRHVMRTATPLPVLVIATIRDGAVTMAIDHLLADLTAEGRVSTIRLAGLSCPEVAAFLGDDAHAEAMHELTAGNPLYLRELMKAGVGATEDERMPTSIVEVICRRAGRLSAEGQQLLAAAAISGLRFNLATIADAVGLDLGRATAAADEAARHGLLSASLDDPVRDLEFVHPLVRRALVESMTDARRGLLHHLIGHAMQRRHGDDGRHAAELYFHYASSSESTDRRPAIAAARRASAHAAAQLGYDEGFAHATAALTLFDLLGGPEADRAWLVVELADARRAIADPAAAATYRDAATLARSTRTPAVLARAALGLTDAWAFSGEVIDDRREILDEALDALGDDEPALRARLAARLASELYYVGGSLERRRELCDQAVAVARTIDDHLAIAAALDARSYATWGLGGAAERLACGHEIAVLAERARSPELTLAGLGWRITASLELGDITTSRRALAGYQRLAGQIGLPRYIWYGLTREAMLHSLAGDHEQALATATRALTVGVGEADHDNVHHALVAQMTIFRKATARPTRTRRSSRHPRTSARRSQPLDPLRHRRRRGRDRRNGSNRPVPRPPATAARGLDRQRRSRQRRHPRRRGMGRHGHTPPQPRRRHQRTPHTTPRHPPRRSWSRRLLGRRVPLARRARRHRWRPDHGLGLAPPSHPSTTTSAANRSNSEPSTRSTCSGPDLSRPKTHKNRERRLESNRVPGARAGPTIPS